MAFSKIQGSGTSSTSNSTSQILIIPSSVTSGNFLTVVACVSIVGTDPSGGPHLSVTDSNGNTWTKDKELPNAYATTSATVAIFHTTASSTGSLTITVSSTISGKISLDFIEWSAGSPPTVDVTTLGNGGATMTPTQLSMTLTATDMVVAGFHLLTSGLAYTAGSGFTLDYTTNSGLTAPFASEYNAARTPGALSPTISLSSASSWTGAAVAYSDAAPPTFVYAADGGAYSDGSATCRKQGDPGMAQNQSISASISWESGSDGEAVFGLSLSADSGSESEAVLATILSLVSLSAVDEASGPDVAIAAILSGDSATAFDPSFPMVATVVAAVDSATAQSEDLPFLMTSAFYQAVDPATGQESAPAPTAWTVDSFEEGETILGILLSGDRGIPVESGSESGSLLITAMLWAVDLGSASETQRWSSILYAVDIATAVEYSTDVNTVILVSEGYHVYANTGVGDPIDYLSPVATVLGFQNTTWTSFGLSYPGVWKFGVRAYNSAGEEDNVDCVCTIILDAAGNDITRTPVPPSGLRAIPTAGGGIRVEWYYYTADPLKQPTGFRVYAVTGAPIDYSSPIVTVPYAAGFLNSFYANIPGLSGGSTYTVGVRAYNSVGSDGNTIVVTVTADATGPLPVTNLTATPIV